MSTTTTTTTRAEPKMPLGSSKNYEFTVLLGEGAFSEVYKAKYKPNGVVCALKKIDIDGLEDKFKALCIAEVKLLKAVTSPFIIKCFEAFVEDHLYISLEYADNGDLEGKILQMQKRGTIFSERTIWYYFHKICHGIKDLHAKRILHRDLKPANVFMYKNGNVKIGDLGLGRMFSQNTAKAVTRVGTEYYMSPERNATGGYNFMSDIWSLGCLLYEMATLRSPFNGETKNAYSLHKKIEAGEILPLPMNLYSKQLNYFAFQCMNVDVTDRPTAEQCFRASRKMFDCYEAHLNMKKPVRHGYAYQKRQQ
uniref:non-specific serine/threonine protein kinase n=1 Tax=Panagrellus redivivus TaxID=6233 RepID=A0A7E4VH74_PANRE